MAGSGGGPIALTSGLRWKFRRHFRHRKSPTKVSADMKKPGKSDPSRPREDGYDYKREFYRSAQVAEDYDFHRFSTPERQKRNARKWAAIRKALSRTSGVRTILDLPCGTGRFTGALARDGYEIIGSDISLEMLQKAASIDTGTTAEGKPTAVRGYVQEIGRAHV